MLADRYVRMDFTSQEDFEQNYTLRIPDRFNFAYDIVDEYARLCPEKPAMIWTNVAGEERRFSFGNMSRKSNQAANFFRSLGLKKGDPVLLVLKRRYEYWFCALALMKLGCILIPATAQLAKRYSVKILSTAARPRPSRPLSLLSGRGLPARGGGPAGMLHPGTLHHPGRAPRLAEPGGGDGPAARGVPQARRSGPAHQ